MRMLCSNIEFNSDLLKHGVLSGDLWKLNCYNVTLKWLEREREQLFLVLEPQGRLIGEFRTVDSLLWP